MVGWTVVAVEAGTLDKWRSGAEGLALFMACLEYKTQVTWSLCHELDWISKDIYVEKNLIVKHFSFSSAPSDFTEMVNMGMRLEEGVREGRLSRDEASTSKRYGSNFGKKKVNTLSN